MWKRFSALLFNIVLLDKKKRKGIRIGKEEVKLSYVQVDV